MDFYILTTVFNNGLVVRRKFVRDQLYARFTANLDNPKVATMIINKAEDETPGEEVPQ